jgi:nucleotide-binding universal stress UspA family protein
MTILVPTDFSDNANHAIEYAVEFAKAMDSQLILLHMLSETHATRQEIENATDQLLIIQNTLTEEFPHVKCRVYVEVGGVVEGILEAAGKNNVDLIVMGTQGATNLGRLFFGSNTALIIEKAHCTVLSIPGNYTFRKPEKMLFSTNFSREDLKAAVQFVLLAKAFDATVIIAHVSTEHEREDVERSLAHIFTQEIAEITDYDKITCKVSSDNTISMGLDTLISETGSDVIALSTRRRKLLEKVFNPSITKKYSLQADIPLLAYHHDEMMA